MVTMITKPGQNEAGNPGYIFAGPEDPELIVDAGCGLRCAAPFDPTVSGRETRFVARRAVDRWNVTTHRNLAIVPYLLVRGPVNRIARRSHKEGKEPSAAD